MKMVNSQNSNVRNLSFELEQFLSTTKVNFQRWVLLTS